MFNTEPWTQKEFVYPLPSYAFLPEVLNEVGKAIFNGDWTGDEPTNFGPGPKIPSASDVFIGESDSPQNFELLKAHQRAVFELIEARPVGTPTYEQWCDARDLWYQKERERPKAAKRLRQTVETIHDLAAEGQVVFTCALGNGEMIDVSPAIWNCRRSTVWERFLMCRVTDADLFAPKLIIEQRPPSDEEIFQLLDQDPEAQVERQEYWNAFTRYLFVRHDRLASAVGRIQGWLRGETPEANQGENNVADAPLMQASENETEETIDPSDEPKPVSVRDIEECVDHCVMKRIRIGATITELKRRFPDHKQPGRDGLRRRHREVWETKYGKGSYPGRGAQKKSRGLICGTKYARKSSANYRRNRRRIPTP